MAATVTIGKYTPPVVPNPYDDVITQLAAAGEDAAANIETTKAEAAKTGRKFSDAANAKNYTAKRRARQIREKDEWLDVDNDAFDALADDAAVRVIYTLGPKQIRPGRPRKDAEPAAPADAPAKGKGK